MVCSCTLAYVDALAELFKNSEGYKSVWNFCSVINIQTVTQHYYVLDFKRSMQLVLKRNRES